MKTFFVLIIVLVVTVWACGEDVEQKAEKAMVAIVRSEAKVRLCEQAPKAYSEAGYYYRCERVRGMKDVVVVSQYRNVFAWAQKRVGKRMEVKLSAKEKPHQEY